MIELLIALLVSGIVVAMAFQILIFVNKQSSKRDAELDQARLLLLWKIRLAKAADRHPRICDDPGMPSDSSLGAVRDSLEDWLGTRAQLIRLDCQPTESRQTPSRLIWRLRIPGWPEDQEGVHPR